MITQRLKDTTHIVTIRIPNASYERLWRLACAEKKAPGKIAKRMLCQAIEDASKQQSE